MSDKLQKIKAEMETGIRATARRLIEIASDYRSTKETLGSLLAAYQQLFPGASIRLPPDTHDAMAMGRAPGLTRARQRKASNAVKAAVALTERDMVLTPLRIKDIHGILLESGRADEKPPTLATLESTIIRSGLFEKAGKGSWRLIQPVSPNELEMRQLQIE